MTQDNTTTYNRIRQAREAAGLSQGQVAKKMGLHRPTITEIEAGRRRVTSDEISQFSDLYGVSVNWLVNGPTTEENGINERTLLAARELSKMTDKDLDRIIGLIKMLKKSEGE